MQERNILFPNLEGNFDWDVLWDAPDHAEVAQALRREQSRILMREARQRMTPEERDQQRANDRERMKIARLNATPEQRARERERERNRPPRKLNSEQRERRLELARNRILSPEQRERRRELSRNRLRPFWGVDGEGAGTDDKGRQHYILMAASGPGADEHRVVQRDGAALSVRDCLEFLLSLPAGPILVGFAFGYDSNQIIRGMKIETQKRIIHPPKGEYGGSLSTFWGDYAVTWQYFRVSRIDRSTGKAVLIPGSTRTVYDVIGSYQSTFASALEAWNIGSDEERAFVARMKDKRRTFEGLTGEMIDYCALECRQLALLMTDFRNVCIETDTVPERWCGAGWIAASMLKRHAIPKRPLTAKEVLRDARRSERVSSSSELAPSKRRAPARTQLRRPERDYEFEVAATAAFYGGRFEVSTIGHIPGPVYEMDVNSAYPDAMPSLPCSLHTRWIHRPNARRLPKNGLYLAKVAFNHRLALPWCGLPFRRKQRLYWPYQGTGWYWSCEIEAAQRCLFADVSVRDLWVAERTCNCRQYDWVPELYEKRGQLGSKTRGCARASVFSSGRCKSSSGKPTPAW
jgi:hypothetical protein